MSVVTIYVYKHLTFKVQDTGLLGLFNDTTCDGVGLITIQILSNLKIKNSQKDVIQHI